MQVTIETSILSKIVSMKPNEPMIFFHLKLTLWRKNTLYFYQQRDSSRSNKDTYLFNQVRKRIFTAAGETFDIQLWFGIYEWSLAAL